jgi:hypothetical protein
VLIRQIDFVLAVVESKPDRSAGTVDDLGFV